MRVDPIESEPLYHFHPGAGVLRATRIEGSHLVEEAQRSGVGIVAFPDGRGRYARDVADAARSCRTRGLLAIGSADAETILQGSGLLPVMDATTLDLTSAMTAGRRELVLDRLGEYLSRTTSWIELVVRLVPGQTDTDRDLDGLCRVILRSVGAEVPMHFAAGCVPGHRESLQRARWIALSNGLHWVYTDDPDNPSDHVSWCPGCDTKLVVRRTGIATLPGLRGGACACCGWEMPGTFACIAERGAA